MTIVYVTPRFPYPSLKGDQVRAFNQIKELSKSNEIYLVSFRKSSVKKKSKKVVQKYCKKIEIVNASKIKSFISAAYEFLVSGRSINETYFCNTDLHRTVEDLVRSVNPDLLHCSMIRAAPCGFNLTTANHTELVQSIDFIDALSLNLERKTEQSPWWQRWLWWLELARVKKLEKVALHRFDLAFVTSDIDRRTLSALVDLESSGRLEKPGTTEGDRVQASEVCVIPNGVDIEKFEFGGIEDRSERDIVFTGNMSYAPNVVAVCHFVDTIFSRVREAYPEIRFHVVGAEPTRSVKRLNRTDGVDVHGFVNSIAEHLRGAALSVCPLQTGAGIQNKVLEAMATGTPVVASPVAMEGIRGAEASTHYAEGNDPDAFANAVLELLRNKERRTQMGRRARRFIEENYTWQAQAEKMVERFDKTMSRV
jgi:sugar transferase (PEP-CTERM/EpsH1 system associated)